MILAITFSIGLAVGGAHPAVTLGADRQTSVISIRSAAPKARVVASEVATGSGGGIGALTGPHGTPPVDSGGGIGALTGPHGTPPVDSGGGIGALTIARRALLGSGGSVGVLTATTAPTKTASGGGIGALCRFAITPLARTSH